MEVEMEGEAVPEAEVAKEQQEAAAGQPEEE